MKNISRRDVLRMMAMAGGATLVSCVARLNTDPLQDLLLRQTQTGQPTNEITHTKSPGSTLTGAADSAHSRSPASALAFRT